MEELRHRAVIENINPSINDGEFAAKRVVGDWVELSADIYADGHDVVNAWLYAKHQSAKRYSSYPLKALVNDAWEGGFRVEKVGAYSYYIEAWVDYALNWQHELRRKVKAGQKVHVELLDGLQYVKAVKTRKADEKKFLQQCIQAFDDNDRYTEAIELACSEALKKIFELYPNKSLPTRSKDHPLWVDREKARFSTWYEFFPRSSGTDPKKHGSFEDAAKRLPYVAEMGFDVVYFPPIHPIGRKHRKGKNNATTAEEGDVGSPWAIGAEEGGHKDIHPELGSLADFRKLIKTAQSMGLEVAMDFALQCAPDHPYVKEHPQWFKWRPDGTVQYAENPPKKYQDILPINFACDDWKALWKELRDVMFYWIDQGIRIFRVDNPHTKPFSFWRWLIAEVRKKHPDVLFLSEAFTRPKIMHMLAKVGFNQSYTYFTWRNNKAELMEYMHELSTDPSQQYFRPNFWPNTPDILPYELQQPKESTFLARHFLAATLSSNYGMYGPVYENMVFQGVPGKEEYFDSEKYEIARHVWDGRGKLKAVIRSLNHIRRQNPALQYTFNYLPCEVNNGHLMAYFKSDGADNHLLMLVNLDPYHTQAGIVSVPLHAMGLPSDAEYMVKDLLTQESYAWRGEHNYVELNPNGLPFHCFQVIS